MTSPELWRIDKMYGLIIAELFAAGVLLLLIAQAVHEFRADDGIY